VVTDGSDGWSDERPDDGGGPTGGAAGGDPDGLDDVSTPMSRLVGRTGRALAVLLAVVLVVPLAGWLWSELDFRRSAGEVTEVAADAAASVYLVRGVGCDGRGRSGSAFVAEIAGERVLLTNRHVVDRVESLGLRALTGGTAVEVTGVRLAEGPDVAVLTVADPDGLPPPLPVGRRPQQGQEVRLVGFPAAQPFTTAGTVASVDARRVLLDLEVDPGASGSPVIDGDGVVIAQVFGRTPDGLGVATPAAVLVDAATRATAVAPGC
jgi:hypothetical protein